MENEILHEVAVREIQHILANKRYQNLRVVATEKQTGTSFFQGNDRLCKVLKTKRGLRIEINVELPEEYVKLPHMESIDEATAYAKHYGTVRHIYRGEDMKDIKKIMTAAIDIFAKNMSLKQQQVI